MYLALKFCPGYCDRGRTRMRFVTLIPLLIADCLIVSFLRKEESRSVL